MINITVSQIKKHKISPYLYMQFMEPLGTADSSVDAGWDYQNDCWYDMLIEKVTELSPTMVRFGGCFASYYHWREAIGKNRIPMYNLLWDGVYSNAVGTHEIIDFCRRVEAEPLLVVNMESDGRKNWANPKKGGSRLGTAKEAAEWVSYCNGQANEERIKNGQEMPFNVKYWQIGNETSYDPLGYHSDEGVEATKRFVQSMLNADDSISLIGWGDGGWGDDTWARKMCSVDGLSHIAIHHHFDSGREASPLYGTAYRDDAEKTWEHLLNAHRSLDEHIQKIRSEMHSGKRLAITEGHFALPGRNRCEVLSSWGAGVAYARCLNTIIRNSDIIDIATMADFFGNRWQVNAVILPTPHHSGKAYLQPVGSVMSIFKKNQGEYYADCSADGNIDVTASISEDGKTIWLHAANLSMNEVQEVRLDIPDAAIRTVTVTEIASDPTTEITELDIDVFKPTERTVMGNSFTVGKAAVAAIRVELE